MEGLQICQSVNPAMSEDVAQDDSERTQLGQQPLMGYTEPRQRLSRGQAARAPKAKPIEALAKVCDT